jgi:hypothetical protein
MTENGLFLDGRLHKISQEVTFTRERGGAPPAAWRLEGAPRVALTYMPFYRRTIGLDLGLLQAHLLWTAGHFSGHLLDDDGRAVEVKRLLGWAEEVHARW